VRATLRCMGGGLHHVEINVSDLERSVEFWGWLLHELGCELYEAAQ
jgi:catechol 2,3-dioxygenase-like lactoylglutathione lyase family enzyme